MRTREEKIEKRDALLMVAGGVFLFARMREEVAKNYIGVDEWEKEFFPVLQGLVRDLEKLELCEGALDVKGLGSVIHDVRRWLFSTENSRTKAGCGPRCEHTS